MRFTLHKWSIETTTTTKNRFQTSLRFCFRSLFFSKTKNIFTSAILYFFGEKCSCWSMQQKKRPETYRFRLFALVLATNTWNGNFFFHFYPRKNYSSLHIHRMYTIRDESTRRKNIHTIAQHLHSKCSLMKWTISSSSSGFMLVYWVYTF